jgi:D-arabinose 1-dehydrogenase
MYLLLSTLQVPLLREAGVQQIFNASPLNMGLLSSQGAQEWHLAPPALRQACSDANAHLSTKRSTTLQSVALGFGLGSTTELGCNTVVGCTMPEHVSELMERWNMLYALSHEEGACSSEKRTQALSDQSRDEHEVKEILGKTGLLK